MLSVNFMKNASIERNFILRTVMAPNKILRSFSVTSPTHDVNKAMLTSQGLQFAKSVFIFRVLSHIVSYISGDNPKFVYAILSFPPFGYQHAGLITVNHVI